MKRRMKREAVLNEIQGSNVEEREKWRLVKEKLDPFEEITEGDRGDKRRDKRREQKKV